MTATERHARGDLRLLASIRAMQHLQDGPARRPRRSEKADVSAAVERRRDLDTNYVILWEVPTKLFEFLPGDIEDHEGWRCRSLRADRTYITFYEVGAIT